MNVDEMKARAQEALELAEKATPGPWKHWTYSGFWVISRDGLNIADCGRTTDTRAINNTMLIAASRELVPDLACAVIELAAELERLRGECAWRPAKHPSIRDYEGSEVLCVDMKARTHYPFIALYEGGRWFIYADKFGNIPTKVTHWVPLPDPPEDK